MTIYSIKPNYRLQFLIMRSVEQLVQSIRTNLADEYYQRLYDRLIECDKAWLVEELIRQIAKNDNGPTLGKQIIQNLNKEDLAAEEEARIKRIKKMHLNEWKLSQFIEKFDAIKTDRENDCAYSISPPEVGGEMLLSRQRTALGENLLEEAKDILYALLYGGKDENVDFKRVEHELLTIVLPRSKAHIFGFLRTVTELSSIGNWRDPHGSCDDESATNSILEIQYGEVESERIGDGIISTLRLINELEVNEKVLYARMRNVEQSSLKLFDKEDE